MVNGRQEWMHRGHADYDPNRIGDISQIKVLAALVGAGKFMLAPVFHSLRYDLAMDDEGRISRIQCKTGHITRGAVVFPTYSLRAAKRETEWRRVAADYQGQVDFFGVYCPENEKVYLVPIAVACGKRGCSLRLEPTKNNQRKLIRWAKDFEVNPLPIMAYGNGVQLGP